MRNHNLYPGTPCKITAPMDQMCKNGSKNRLTSQNFTFFQCIFSIFQILHLSVDMWIRNIQMWWLQTGSNNIKMLYI